jgi:uncharacterized protein with HEPN domain
MQPETKKFLYDIWNACESILKFTAGKTLTDYVDDLLLRSAVERQFEIIGEAINQMSRIDPGTVERIDDYRQIIAFRNILIHGYGQINDQVVWRVVTTQLPTLLSDIRQILKENGDT